MKKNLFGYIRVSTHEQNIDRQRIALAPYNIPPQNLYIDMQSGKNFDRPAYQKMMRKLGSGDLLFVKSIDRLGRNYGEIIEQWRVITREKEADIKILDMPMLDTTYHKDLLGTFISDLVLQVLSFTAQTERDAIRQRQAEGIAAAKAKGAVFGKAPFPVPSNFDELCRKWSDGELSAQETASMCGFSLRTLYNKSRSIRAEGINF